MLKVGVIGSRKFPVPELVLSFVKVIEPYDIMIISGACPNSPDQWAVDAAKLLNIPYREYPADWNGPYGKGAGFARNTIIVQQSDVIIAFHADGSRGTMDTVIKAIKAKKPVMTVTTLEGLQEAYEIVKALASLKP